MAEKQPLSGTKALITGASSGIGRETSYALAREGADVALAARREDRLREHAGQIEDDYGVETAVLPTDVSDPDQANAMIEGAVDSFRGLDVLVNNAGIGGRKTRKLRAEKEDHYTGVAAHECDVRRSDRK